MSVDHSRRMFLSVAAGSVLLPRTARSYSRILGANDRIQIGQIGCGHRAVGHRRMLKLSAETDPKFDFRSVCDLWTVNRQRAVDHSHQLFGQAPKAYKYSEEMLADPQLDAVMIATGDHQHAKILAEVVKAGKDCYCEKPMANTIEDAMLARDTVQGEQTGCADGLAMAERSLSAQGARHRPFRQAGQDRIDQPELELQWPSMARPERQGHRCHPRTGYRLEALVAGPRRRAHSILGLISSSAYIRISPAVSPTSGIAMVRALRISTWIRSFRTKPSRTAAFSSGTTGAKIRTP